MIVTRTPLRISFAGGGTDLPAFYREEPGACFSATITAYMYLCVTRKFDGQVRVGYSRTENVQWASELEHDIARETLLDMGVSGGIEVVSVADVPAGTGLGSSSAYAVGLLRALYGYYTGGKGETEPHRLAEQAAGIEIEKCGHPIGKQDQYAAAYGGLRLYEFHPDNVKVNTALNVPLLEERLMLFHLGGTRDSNGLLKDQPIDIPLYREMANLARVLYQNAGDVQIDAFAMAMDTAWQLKRRIARVDPEVDGLLALAKQHGALAGKLCGAGGCGFLLLLVPPERQDEIRACLNVPPHRELKFKFEPHGSQVVYAD